MIQRSAPLKRTQLKRRPRKKRPEGWDDPEFLAWLRTWPCYVCLRQFCILNAIPFWWACDAENRRSTVNHRPWITCGPTEAAHVGPRGLGQKCKDREAMPLGTKHHEHQTAGGGPESHHTLGKRFWEHHGLEKETVLAILWDLYAKETGK